MDIALIAAGLAVYGWLLLIVHRQGVRKQLSWFAIYVVWEVLVQCEQLVTWLISHRLYFRLYWWIEAAGILLTIAGVTESFLIIFRGFTKMLWFRLLVAGVIAAVVAYSAWKAVLHPPVQGNWLTAFVVGTEFLFRWGILGIALLTFALSAALGEPSETREDVVLTGFGIMAGASVLANLSFSLFGNKFFLFNRYAPSVGYFMAALLWIRIFSRPVEGPSFAELGIGPEDLLKLVRRYRQDVGKAEGKQ